MPRQPGGRQPTGRQPTGRQPEGVVLTPGAFLSGTLLASATAAALVAGGRRLQINLTLEVWVALGAAFDAQRQNIINGLVSAQSEVAGFNALRASIPVTALTRVSDEVAELVLPALPTYAITANEVLTMTVPTTALVSATQHVAGPNVTIQASSAGDAIGTIRRNLTDTIRSKQAFRVPDVDRDYPANL